MINRRCIDILETLVNDNTVQSVDELSSRFCVSNRMIRYDIDSINNFLKENNIQLGELWLYLNWGR